MTTPILVKAQEGHIKYIWKIRNHPEIRSYCLNSDEIKYENHKEWIKDKLDQYQMLNHDQGYLRQDEKGYVSIAILPEFQDGGLAKQLLQEVKEGKAVIMPHNLKSLNLFICSGFNLTGFYIQKDGGAISEFLCKFENEHHTSTSINTFLRAGYKLKGYYLEK